MPGAGIEIFFGVSTAHANSVALSITLRQVVWSDVPIARGSTGTYAGALATCPSLEHPNSVSCGRAIPEVILEPQSRAPSRI